MKSLSALDAAFLHLESPAMPMHVGAAHVFELPAGFQGRFVDHLRRHMAERLPLAPVLRRRLWWMPLNLANPAWVDAEPDLQEHIVEVALPARAAQGDGLQALYQTVGRLHGKPMDRSRPLWRMHVLEGLAPTADGRPRVGLYTQFHHAAVDGQAAVALGQVILDLAPDAPVPERRPSTRRRVFRLGALDMLRGAITQEAQQLVSLVRKLPHTASALAGAAGQVLHTGALRPAGTASVSNLRLAPRTLFNVNVQPGRRFAGLSLPLALVKDRAHAQGATVNDLVLYLCSTALRAHLARHDGVPRKPLVAAVPITLRTPGDTSSSNQASMSLVSLGTHLSDPARRLAHIRTATAGMKATIGSLRDVLPTDLPGIGLPWLMQALSGLYDRTRLAERLPPVANVVISNVPGPQVPLYLAGARMRCNLPTSIAAHGLALNITVQSYDQQLDFGLVADARAVPDLARLAADLQAAFDEVLTWPAHQPAGPKPRRAAAGKGAAGQAAPIRRAPVQGGPTQRTEAKKAAQVKPATGGKAPELAAAVKKAAAHQVTAKAVSVDQVASQQVATKRARARKAGSTKAAATPASVRRPPAH